MVIYVGIKYTLLFFLFTFLLLLVLCFYLLCWQQISVYPAVICGKPTHCSIIHTESNYDLVSA